MSFDVKNELPRHVLVNMFEAPGQMLPEVTLSGSDGTEKAE